MKAVVKFIGCLVGFTRWERSPDYKVIQVMVNPNDRTPEKYLPTINVKVGKAYKPFRAKASEIRSVLMPLDMPLPVTEGGMVEVTAVMYDYHQPFKSMDYNSTEPKYDNIPACLFIAETVVEAGKAAPESSGKASK